MARKKVNRTFITNPAKRSATFKRRRRGLIKVVEELSILCGTEACAIIYGPDEAQPEVYPNEPEARQMLQKFRSLPEFDQSNRRTTQEMFLRDRANKLSEQLKRVNCQANNAEMLAMMYEGMLGYGVTQYGLEKVTELSCFVEKKIKEVKAKITAERAEASATAQEAMFRQFGGSFGNGNGSPFVMPDGYI